MIRKKQLGIHSGDRRGAAAVELAVVAPLMVILLLGAIDSGQLVNVWHIIENASREAARVAAKSSTENVSDVEDAVYEYLTETYPNVSESAIEAAATVTVQTESGTPVTGDGLAGISTGDPIVVEVSFQFDSVRWLGDLNVMQDRTVETATTMRRE